MTLWVVHVGNSRNREEFALRENLVAVGWEIVPDLSQATGKLDVHKAIQESYPTADKKTILTWSGMLWRFTKEMEVGDLVVMPRKGRPSYAVGVICGPYNFRTDA